jgi:DNA-binding NarL/FixJ family response regulator
VAEGTVKIHLHAIYEKLDIHSRTELTAALADRRGKSKLD